MLYLLQLVQALKYEDFEEIMRQNDSVSDRKDSLNDSGVTEKSRYKARLIVMKSF